jgi:hypothetical protein
MPSIGSRTVTASRLRQMRARLTIARPIPGNADEATRNPSENPTTFLAYCLCPA